MKLNRRFFRFYNCFCWIRLLGIYWVLFVRLCGSRTAGELLFFLQQKKSNQKNAATLATPLESRGPHLASTIIMLRQNSQKTLRQAGTESP